MRFRRLAIASAASGLLLASSFFVLAVYPQPVRGDAMSDLQAQIQQLLAQIQALQAQIAQLQQGTNFTATPLSGAPPLTVTFTTTGQVGSLLSLDFGDNSSQQVGIGCGASTCPATTIASVNTPHTYTRLGTYTAKLSRVPGPTEANCYGADCWVVGRVTITVGSTTYCVVPIHDLQRGDTDADVGGDVTLLQTFLARDPSLYPEGLVTGSFGRLTERAVRRFQQAWNISPTGFVGPLTREAIRRSCAGDNPGRARYSFRARPNSGTAPLDVTFTATRVETGDAVSYKVDFGDSTPHADMQEDSGGVLSTDHTYTTGGSFTAKLLLAQDLCGGGLGGFGCTSELQVDSVAITISAPPVDVCPNIEGLQTSIPTGMMQDSSGNCVAAGPPPERSCTFNGVTYPPGSIAPFSLINPYQWQNAQAIPASAMHMVGTPDANNGWNACAMDCNGSSYVQYKCEDGDWVRITMNYPYPYPPIIAAKPVIYLYPTKTENVTVKLQYKGEFSSSYPDYDPALGGWRVIAHPDGTLTNLADGREYSYLFWEGKDYPLNIDGTKGFVVKGSDTRAFLQTKLAALGLTPREYNEFIVYWLPKMEHNPYNFIQFVGKEYEDAAPLTISPKPDSILRVFMAYKPLDTYKTVTPQTIQPFARRGFSVVEWGGMELGN